VKNAFIEHCASLKKELSCNVKLMGSRRWGLCYPECDIDGVVICDDNPQEILDALESYHKKYYKLDNMKKLVTKAGLSLLIIPEINIGTYKGKLDWTIQSTEINNFIISSCEEILDKMSEEDKCLYAHNMRELYKNKDEAGMLKLKSMLKVLKDK
ncbi:Hypothetical protein ORPV_368, partial [Orpheovirus IHUMI-LCC2]